VLAGLLVWRGLASHFRDVTARPSSADLVRDFRAILVHPVFLAISLAQGLMMMARQVILTFLPLYIQIRLGRGAFELGLYIAMLHAVGTVSQPVLGLLSDRIGRKAVLVPSFAILAVLYLLLAVAPPGWPLAALVLAIGVFFYTLTNVTGAAVFDAAGKNIQASAMGLASLVTQVIVLPAPVLAGWMVQRWGYGSAFVLAAAFMLLGLAVMLPLRLYQGTARTPRFSG
jgi:sugar phosphate permease